MSNLCHRPLIIPRFPAIFVFAATCPVADSHAECAVAETDSSCLVAETRQRFRSKPFSWKIYRRFPCVFEQAMCA